ncbi:MAG: DNA polymerase II large subunit [Nanoarchaeota archaeon]|nr:DNA polymerase II large subunit [Nanoarchaeota archaeon]
MNINQYFKHIQEKIDESYRVAESARSKGLDPLSYVEVPQAKSFAERVVGLISVVYPQITNTKIVKRIIELEKEFSSLDPAIALTIAEEVSKEKFCKFKDHHEAIEAGIRIGLAYMTLGVVSSPIEGFVQLKLNKTSEGKDYFVPFYSGPIRSAGGTEAAFSLVIIDYLREIFGYAKYDPWEDEVKRGIHECYEYHERVTNLQYLPSEKELEFLMKNIPVQVAGDPSESREVYNYKDLPRVETNFIRGGFALVMGEAMAQKAPKVLARIKKLKKQGFKLSDWDWLEDFVKLQKKIGDDKTIGSSSSATYIKDIVAGRPILGHPSKSGSFRLRYGRCRNTGYSTLALHPATMAITGDFIAVGTQLKIEKPTKGCTIACCDSIDGPIVKFKDGSVRQISDFEEARRIYKEVQEILYLGDILVPYGDFLNRNHLLIKPGYVEQYWLEQLLAKEGKSSMFPSFEEALRISEKYRIPLHPSFIYYWSQISYDEFLAFVDWLAHGRIDSTENKMILPYGKTDRERFAKGKRALELIGCEHKVSIENVVLNKKDSNALLFNFGLNFMTTNLEKEIDEMIKRIPKNNGDVLGVVNFLCKFEIKDKAGTFIGARMGRPEKAKLRKLTGSPHVLFPVGSEGGRLRSIQSAIDVGSIKSDFPIYYCSDCDKETIYPICEKCKNLCKKMNYCPSCDRNYDGKCHEHDNILSFRNRRIDIRNYFDHAKKLVGLRIEEIPVVIKGVRGTSSEDHSCENLAKGILRAKYNLHVNKDGTIRYDMTEMPLTHFKPKEIGTSIEKLRELGYLEDMHGKVLENEEQILEIFPHDIILPACPDSQNESADDVFLKVSQFIDEELEKIYGLKRFFNAKTKGVLIGELFACIAPHICTAVIGRVIGFSKTQAFLASPYIHAAMRRDTDGDEAAVIFLMDMLINFSRKFLPAHRGGTQDAPLVLNTHIRAGEVDDMIFDVDVGKKIPLGLYEAAEKEEHPGNIKMEQVRGRIGGNREFKDIFFSYDTDDINIAPLCSSYKTLPTMQEKVEKQMTLCKKIRAVDVSDVARLIIERHFIRDIRGNLRKFSMQVFRCVGCNQKFRRPSLRGKCTKCGGKIIFTISEGSIIKYMQAALDLAKTFGVSSYLLECLELTRKDIEGIFGREKEKQESISKWF